MSGLLQEIRYALRQLLKSPGFTAVAVLTLALGIGANTAIFSVINSVILRPLPYKQPDHLVQIWGNFAGIGLPDNQNAISAPEFRDLETQNHCFSHVAAISSGQSFNLRFGDYPQRIEGALVSPSLFPLLDVQPFLGRAFLPAEGVMGQNKVILISHGLWKRAFGGDPSIVGRRLTLNGIDHEVVGVMPVDFQSQGVDIWAPLRLGPEDLSPSKRGNHGLLVLGRVKPDLDFRQAQADLRSLSKAVVEQNPEYPYARFEFAFGMTPLLQTMVNGTQTPLWILGGAVALVLLIACVNIANLLLVRAAAREREVATRLALGATRSQLVRQWLTESVVLSLLGGVTGLLLAQAGLKFLVHISSTILPRIVDASLDGPVLIFTMLASIVSGILFGLAPALHTVHGNQMEVLRGSERSFTTGRASQRMRHVLIVAELSLSLILLSGAGLMIRSLLHVQSVDAGFRPENVLTMRVSLPESKYANLDQVRVMYQEAVNRISRLPGVESAGATSDLPLDGGGSGTTTMDSSAVTPDQASPEADQCVVTPGYFQTMGITLLSGRAFDARDTNQSQPVAVIDETLARTYWPHQSAVGQRLHKGGAGGNPSWATIIGVVRHVRSRSLETPSRIQVYWPEAQMTERSLSFVIHTKTPVPGLAASVQREIASMDADQPAYNIKPMEALMLESLAFRRLGASLLAVFSGLAVLLATIGLYGVMAYWVSQRTHEIGLRMALGAQPWDVIRQTLGQALRSGLLGIALGLLGSYFMMRVLKGLLFEVAPNDPVTLLGASMLLLLVSALAAWIPARRASRVDPLSALKNQ